jgi:hypothetical protein
VKATSRRVVRRRPLREQSQQAGTSLEWRFAMNAMTRNRWAELEDDPGLVAHQGSDLSFPDEEEDAFVFCPECGEMAERFVFIEHKSWCAYGESAEAPHRRAVAGTGEGTAGIR